MRGTTLCNHSYLLFLRPLLQPQVIQQQHGLSSFGESISFLTTFVIHDYNIVFLKARYQLFSKYIHEIAVQLFHFGT